MVNKGYGELFELDETVAAQEDRRILELSFQEAVTAVILAEQAVRRTELKVTRKIETLKTMVLAIAFLIFFCTWFTLDRLEPLCSVGYSGYNLTK